MEPAGLLEAINQKPFLLGSPSGKLIEFDIDNPILEYDFEISHAADDFKQLNSITFESDSFGKLKLDYNGEVIPKVVSSSSDYMTYVGSKAILKLQFADMEAIKQFEGINQIKIKLDD